MASKQRLGLLIIILCLTAITALGENVPHIGYLYPAGGRQGTTIIVTAGGQFLRGPEAVYVTGAKGVRASVIEFCPPINNLDKEHRDELQRRMQEVRDKRISEIPGKHPLPPGKSSFRKTNNINSKDPNTPEVKIPNHPLLYDLENKSLRELAHISTYMMNYRKKQQPNRQIAESVLIKVNIDPDAPPGKRELRIVSAAGLTNPIIFEVGQLPEECELEPNTGKINELFPRLLNFPNIIDFLKDKPFDLPVVLNGQIMPGDVDSFRFRAAAGQQLVIQAKARELIPYLADAVPGWFQATLTLYDAKGNEVAFDDDYRFSPDPVIFYKVPVSGEYELKIHDSIYRGREDFVYRIAIGQLPFITQIFPLGAQKGGDLSASISGWNLSQSKVSLDTQSTGDSPRQTSIEDGKLYTNTVTYAVDTLPESSEVETNDSTFNARQILIPVIINGRIDKPGDIDMFKFQAKAGDEIAAEVDARRLNSPLDSVLRLTDETGKVIAWNDDYTVKDSNFLFKDSVGLITHQADSYLTTKITKDGTYYVNIADSQQQGGDAYAYRLRISPLIPDFELRTTPSSITVRPGGNVPISVYALRKDGFNSEIEITLKNAPVGYKLTGNKIPAGSDHIRMTLTVPSNVSNEPIPLYVEGLAAIGGKNIIHQTVPADDMMQAFLYRHLVPCEQLMVFPTKSRWWMPPMQLANSSPVHIAAGKTVDIKIRTPRRPGLQAVQFELNDAPKGLTLQNSNVVSDGLTFQLKADKDIIKSPFADNLIVEAFTENQPKTKDGKPAAAKQRVSVGFIPAIPIVVSP